MCTCVCVCVSICMCTCVHRCACARISVSVSVSQSSVDWGARASVAAFVCARSDLTCLLSWSISLQRIFAHQIIPFPPGLQSHSRCSLQNVHALNNDLHTLAAQWHTSLQQQNRTDMAVVVQSYQEGIGPNLTIGFLNKLDCFHPSELGGFSRSRR